MRIIEMEQIGIKIKKKRLLLELSQKKLADMCYISNTYLCDIEKGRTDPSLKTLVKIAKALNLDVGDLI